jgi:GTPase SAR1 family protein
MFEAWAIVNGRINFDLVMSDSISFSSNRNSIQKYKIVLVGDQNVGKSSIIARYIRNEFDPTKNVRVR